MDRQTENTPNGIRIRGNSIQIDFYYNGKRYREALKLEPTAKNIKYASKMKDAILFDIERGQFDYTKYFPKSKKLQISKEDRGESILFVTIIQKQLEIYNNRYKNGKMSISTLKDYERIINGYLIPTFGKMVLEQITTLFIREWLYNFKKRSKTITNILIPLRTMLKRAVKDGLIVENPMDKVDVADIINDIGLAKEDKIEPFNHEEKELIINAAEGQFKNLIQFGFWSGLRTGELIALRWADIDFVKKVIKITRNIVHREERAPKTKSGIRSLLMLPKAEEALQSQFRYTGKENDFVFHNPNTQKPWSSSGKIGDTWRRLFDNIDIKYRNCYQMRHTFASTLLSNGENLAWIATQLGHINTEMVIRNYGRFIPDSNLHGGYRLKGNY